MRAVIGAAICVVFVMGRGTVVGSEAKLVASDASAGDSFGYSVSISGDTAIVGAVFVNGETGAAYIYQRDACGWTEVKILTANDAAIDDEFGVFVGISGDTSIVGAQRDDPSGSAYIFERNAGGTDNWGEAAKLVPDDGGNDDRFGDSVAIDGDTAVVGAAQNDKVGTNAGAAYIFERDGSGWTQVKTLIALDGASGDEFGYCVSISGDTVIVSATGNDDTGGNSGSAYIFQRDEGGTNNWGQVQKLTADDAAPADLFSSERGVAIDGDTAVVGAQGHDGSGLDSGAAYVFRRDEGGTNNWGQVKILLATDGAAGDRFGMAVGIHEDEIAVGAPDDDSGVPGFGSIYIFARDVDDPNNWNELQKITASDRADGDRFGWTVALSADDTIVGSYLQDAVGGDSGAAYVYCSDEDCNDNGIPDACDIANGTSEDCNDNGVPDECDISTGTSSDANQNGIPDECENQPPICVGGGPYDEPCQGEFTSVQLNGAGASDPDGDLLGFSWGTDCPGSGFDDPNSDMPTLIVDTLPGCVVACNVTLTVDDGLESETCSSVVTITDTTRPSVTCSVEALDEMIAVNFSASDECGSVSVTAVVDIGCAQIPIVSGEVVELECDDDECEWELDDGELEIEAGSAALIVTAVDDCGNEAQCVQDLCQAAAKDDDEDDDEDDDDDHDDDDGGEDQS